MEDVGHLKSRVVFGIFNMLLMTLEPLSLLVSVDCSWKAPFNDCIERGNEGMWCTHSTGSLSSFSY
jgi:hypothetical protein